MRRHAATSVAAGGARRAAMALFSVMAEAAATPVELQPGDHLRVFRSVVGRAGYWHHGIYVGNGWVVHFTDLDGGKTNAVVRPGTIAEFAAGSPVEVVHYDHCDDVSIVLERVRQVLYTADYSLLRHNCEHIAVWCKTGRHESAQINGVRTVAIVSGVVLGAFALAQTLRVRARPAVAAPPRELPRSVQCKATTLKNRPCKNRALAANYGFCAVHRA